MQDDKNTLNKTIHRLEREIEVLKMDKPTSLREGVVTAIDGLV